MAPTAPITQRPDHNVWTGRFSFLAKRRSIYSFHHRYYVTTLYGLEEYTKANQCIGWRGGRQLLPARRR